MPDSHIFSVSDITKAVKKQLEGHFPFVWIKGQVTNVVRPASGHLYFSLRDEESSLAAVWFKHQQKPKEHFDPFTGEVFEDGPRQGISEFLENGQEILCAGKLTVYPPRGSYQLIVELAEETGIGRLHAEFERLQKKLSEQGFFALERKRPLPHLPHEIALITSPKGAAIHDFLRIAETRGQSTRIRIYPVPVQGDAAPKAIVAAIEKSNAHASAQVIILIRGGGSLEDLWAFNTELVAHAVYTSALPVLAGIGHEIDFSLTDLTADVRAATPTHAAQLLWPEKSLLYDALTQRTHHIKQAAQRHIHTHHEKISSYQQALHWYSPKQRLFTLYSQLQFVQKQMQKNMQQKMQFFMQKLHFYITPLATPPNQVITAHNSHLDYLKGKLEQTAWQRLEQKTTQKTRLDSQLSKALEHLFPKKIQLQKQYTTFMHHNKMLLLKAEHRLEKTNLTLEALNPSIPLERGFALVHTEKGDLLRFAEQVQPNDNIRIVIHQGEVVAKVTSTHKNQRTVCGKVKKTQQKLS